MDKVLAGLGAITILAFIGLIALMASTGSTSPVSSQADFAPVINGVQEVEIKAMNSGAYDKTLVKVKAGIPVRFKFSAEKNAGCGRQLVIPDFNKETTVYGDEVKVLEFTPQKPGTYAYRCGMNMFRGKLVVV